MSTMTRTMVLFLFSISMLFVIQCGEEPTDDDTGSTDDKGSDDDSTDEGDEGDGTDDEDSEEDDGEDNNEDDDELVPIDDSSSLVEQVLELKMEERDWKEPASTVGQEIGMYIPTFAFYFTEIDGDSAKAMLGTILDGEQMACNEAKEIEIDLSDNPEFLLGPTTLDIIVEGPDDIARTTINDFQVTGTLEETDDGLYFLGEFTAVMDLRETAKLFEEVDPRTPEAICNTIDTVAGEKSCFPCDDDDEGDSCTKMRATNIEGILVDSITFEAQNADDGCL